MSFRQELSLSHLLKMIFGVVALFSICATTAQAGIVFQDNFNRTGALNGSTASFTAGTNWSATPGFFTDGTKAGASFGLFDDFTSAAYVPLPVAITSGNIYTLSATMHRGPSTDPRAAMFFGFFDAAPSWDGNVPVDEGHAIAIAPRTGLASVNLMLHGSVNANETSVADGTNGTTFGVRLYETAPNVWAAVALELAPTNQLILGPFSPTPISISNIHTIGMISNALLPSYLDNFTLDVTRVSTSPVPEPSTFVLGIAGAAGLRVV
ncbi:MAG: hypothetical protein JNG89_13885, partial [Planctomycetaceae bacterium]|nr:hypothetical protein [Planctomycetaceae bacterium]